MIMPNSKELIAYIEKIERLMETIQNHKDECKGVFLESKANGFDNKAMRSIIRLRKLDRQKRLEEQSILDLYKAAIGLE